MGRLKSSWRLMTASLRLLKKNPSLLVLPLVSGTLIAIVIAGLTGGVVGVMAWTTSASGGGPATEEETEEWTRGLLVTLCAPVFVVYVLCSFIALLFHAALVACVLRDLEGRRATVRDGLRAAWQRRGAILSWALLYCTVGLILNLVEERARLIPLLGGWLSRLLVRLVGAAWSLVTFLIVPVIVFEELPSLRARLRRSAELFRRTWGEQIAGRVSVGAAVGLVLAVGLLVILGSGAALVASRPLAHAGPVIAGVAVGVVVLGIAAGLASSALNGIYTGVLYSYAVTGMLPQDFSPDLLPQPKRE